MQWIRQKVQELVALSGLLIVVGLIWFGLTHPDIVIDIVQTIVGWIEYVIGIGSDIGSAIGDLFH